MTSHELFYATNRNHLGDDRWNPTGYGTGFSEDGLENLRFGRVTVQADDGIVTGYLQTTGDYGTGNGIALSDYLTKQAGDDTVTKIEAYREELSADTQGATVLGSTAMFQALQRITTQATDILIYIHGFNVSWQDAVAAALSLQIRLNNSPVGDGAQHLQVVLFSWPSDGKAIPYVSYKSDRSEAAASGMAFGRGVLKVRDFLMEICRRTGGNRCEQNIHLLCHSMGNYVLQNTLPRIADYAAGRALPRLFDQIFMCSPDVDADCFEGTNPLVRLPELCRSVTVYFNRHDKSMYLSDYTKGNPERLGCNGVSRPALLDAKITTVDCTAVVTDEGVVEHSYYLDGYVTDDIRRSTDGVAPNDAIRSRHATGSFGNLWAL